MNIQHGQGFSNLDSSNLWERLDSVSENKKKIEEEKRRGEQKGSRDKKKEGFG